MRQKLKNHPQTPPLLINYAMEFEGEKLEFPLDCQFRVIAVNQPNMAFVIETVLMELGVSAPLSKQNQSEGGRYQSYSVDVRIESLDQMTVIDKALRNIAGVKMVL